MIILSFKGAMQSHDVGMGVGEHATEDSKHTTTTHNYPYRVWLTSGPARLHPSSGDHHPPQEVLHATCLISHSHTNKH